jgi:hypothetical protein
MAQADTKSSVNWKRKYNRLMRVLGNLTVPFAEEEYLPSAAPDVQYHMSNDVCHKVNISEWLGNHAMILCSR